MKQFIQKHTAAIVDNARKRIQGRMAPSASEDELAGIPLFLDQLVARFERRADPTLSSGPDIADTAAARGRSFLQPGIGVAHIVNDYGAICQSVGEIAVACQASITAADYKILNQALDDAIAGALTEYSLRREENRAKEEREQLGILAHELRNALASVFVAVSLLKEGLVPSAGRTMDVLNLNLQRAQDLIDTSLAGVRLASADMAIARFSLADLLDDIELPAISEAERRGVRLVVGVGENVTVQGDRQLLVAAVSNLVQNALKFTPSGGTVNIHGQSDGAMTKLIVEDGCGGLPSGEAGNLFEPLVRGGDDHSGVGLALTIVRRAVEAHGGHVYVQDRPGVGCRFVVEVPVELPDQSGKGKVRPVADERARIRLTSVA